MNRFRTFAYQESKNHTRTVWALKCDVRKFFASIDQEILISILNSYIPDERISALLKEVIGSFHSTVLGKGLPLGNLTSQLLVNIYMNEFDQFAKHKLKAKRYVRYADDFVILSADKAWLQSLIPAIAQFLEERLALHLHPNKVFIKSFASGVDFLGWVHFPDHRVLRTATKRRMQKRTADSETEASVRSYLGLLSHGNAQGLAEPLRKRLEELSEA